MHRDRVIRETARSPFCTSMHRTSCRTGTVHGGGHTARELPPSARYGPVLSCTVASSSDLTRDHLSPYHQPRLFDPLSPFRPIREGGNGSTLKIRKLPLRRSLSQFEGDFRIGRPEQRRHAGGHTDLEDSSYCRRPLSARRLLVAQSIRPAPSWPLRFTINNG